MDDNSATPNGAGTAIPQGYSTTAPGSTPQGPTSNAIPQGYSTTAPSGDQIGASTNTSSDQSGFLSRTYETSGAKGAVDLAKAAIGRPIDLYHQAVDAFKSGDWKTGTATALKITHILPDTNDPLNKAANSLIMQPLEEIKANYKQNREQGMGKVASAVTPSANKALADQSVDEMKKGQYSEGVGDVIRGITGSHAIGAVPIVGGVVQNIGDLAGKDIHDKNWKALAGDIAGPMLTMGVGKILEELGAGSSASKNPVTENTVRPGVQKIAGVDVPVSTPQAANQSLASKVLEKGATATGAQKFINEHTQPAAMQANVQNLAQSAMHSADEIRTLRGEPLTAQNPPSVQSVDDVAEFLKKEAKPTYTKLDQAAQPDIRGWERDKANWDAQNPQPQAPSKLPSPTTGPAPTTAENAVKKAQYQSQAQQWKQSESDWLDNNPKPKTFTQLQDQLSNAKDTMDSKFASQVDKEAAIKNYPNYKQEMDNYLTKHSNVVDPSELKSADKIWGQSKRYEWVADKVRSATTGTSSTSSSLKQQPMTLKEASLKGLPSQFDNKFGNGAWKETLGTEGVKNYNDILNALKNPISGSIPFDVFVRDHVFGTLIKGGSLTSPITNNILFNPELGQSVLKLWKSTAKGAAPAVKAAPLAGPPSKAAQRDVYNGASGLAGQ